VVDPWVDPAMAVVLAEMRAAPPVDFQAMPLAEARLRFEAIQAPWNDPPPPVDRVVDLMVGSVAARVYRVAETPSRRLILHVHGGGWTFGSLASHDRAARLLAIASGCDLVAIDYRLAPEAPSPAAVDDVEAVLDAALAGALGQARDPARVAMVGDSAGANIALGLAVRRRDQGLPPLAGLGLLYGCFAPDFDTEGHRRYGDGAFGLTTRRMRWYWANHLGATPPGDPIAAPLGADLAALPPLWITAAGLDPLVDDSLRLAERAFAAGVGATLDLVPGVIHGFAQMSARVPAARGALVRLARFLADA
jgi:acetyl esterase